MRLVLICQSDIIILKMFVNFEACLYKNKQYNVLINIILDNFRISTLRLINNTFLLIKGP